MSKQKREYIDADFERKSSRRKGKLKIQWDEGNLKTVETLAGLGLAQKDIAANFNITEDTFRAHRKNNPALQLAIDKGKAKAITNVARTAYEMANSKQHPTMTQFWLKNRARDQWNEKQILEHQGKIEGSDENKKAGELLADLLSDVKEARRPEPITLDGKDSSDEQD